TRGDFAGHPIRAERPFRLLVETPQGEESMDADAVIDASGVYSLPAAIGAGGIPAPGERALAGRMIRHLGTLHERLDTLRGRRILLVGHGHSAANAVVNLSALAAQTPGTRVIWATRSMNRRPCVEVASDPLPERHRIVFEANRLAAQPPSWLQVERRARTFQRHRLPVRPVAGPSGPGFRRGWFLSRGCKELRSRAHFPAAKRIRAARNNS